MERPEIKWFHLTSYDWPRSSYYAQSGWKNNDLSADAALFQKLVAELGKPRYPARRREGASQGRQQLLNVLRGENGCAENLWQVAEELQCVAVVLQRPAE
ncbi:MAG: hypothetical protein HY704_07650 [Gemmatimonadetes bacterium]|nr:hypothetical protein [Gemmatimonadota bacterium]